MPVDIYRNNDYQVLSINTSKSTEYQIRRMRLTDIDTLVKIEQITWPNESWPFETFFDHIIHPFWHCWILESTNNDNLILGYGLQYVYKSVSHIANLCIDPNQRGRGLGKILLRYMIDHSRLFGASAIELEVNTSNIPAYNLYYKHGFIIIELLEQYYSDNTDAYRMQLSIDRTS
ncbi:unnamed protein product [Rotaria sordida]|uniref:N-acetyltransferase domain-containing protein n=1 Tax=Rotaria sordida TaxID=392033 RepID=A0A815D834_9BILA|nr:unnamed protein product [Rotaria sordida]CAF1293726.1 unnamed protein product [Rotaria sordida]CAF1299007.1 unnamed protein product [Rotaria sordida]CAF1569068.1 unnamed protein product [Rotaria sordida]CAF1572829.1 unnamed protein product [Rotaria sordida]